MFNRLGGLAPLDWSSLSLSLSLLSRACISIVHDVCVYIYTCMCMVDHALCMMDSHGYMSDPLWTCMLLTLWHKYMLKVIALGAYSYHTVCIVIAVWSSRSMSPSDIGFLMYASCISMFKCFEGLQLILARAHWHSPYAQARNPANAP